MSSLSDGKGHAGKVLQHSHAGGYELLLLYSHSIDKDVPTVIRWLLLLYSLLSSQ